MTSNFDLELLFNLTAKTKQTVYDIAAIPHSVRGAHWVKNAKCLGYSAPFIKALIATVLRRRVPLDTKGSSLCHQSNKIYLH